jgi:hypothetical protein
MAKEPGTMPDAELLKGKQVAITGRLASMTRTEAAQLIRAHGGSFASTVSQRTSILIVGQDGWPLQKDGRLTEKLRKAHLFQRSGIAIDVLSEDELLTRIGFKEHTEGVRRLYSTAQLSRLLKIPGSSLRKWVKAGLLSPIETAGGVSHFDFGQVVSAKTLCGLFEAGVKPERLRRSIRQLQSWLGSVDQPLLQLAVLEGNGDLLIRLDDGLAEPSGQRCLDFYEVEVDPALSMTQPPATVDLLFESACDNEEAGHWEEAAEAYRQALLIGGPNSAICFNLANVLYRLGKTEQAVERYCQAVELDRSFGEAWNNLGVVLSDLGREKEAVTAFKQALSQDPGYADARYNLADVLDGIGDGIEARRHWQSYLSQDHESPWANYARRRLTAIGG